jgi:hypothetical protein
LPNAQAAGIYNPDVFAREQFAGLPGGGIRGADFAADRKAQHRPRPGIESSLVGIAELAGGGSGGGGQFTVPVNAGKGSGVIYVIDGAETLIPELNSDRYLDDIIFFGDYQRDTRISISDNSDRGHDFSFYWVVKVITRRRIPGYALSNILTNWTKVV